MNRYTIAIMFFVGLLLSSCNTGGKEAEPEQSQEPTSAALPSMSREQIINLVNAVDDLDLVYNQGFSVNVQGGGAKQNLIFMIPDVQVENMNCPEICLMFAKSQGEQIGHLSAHLGQGCAYYVLYENNRPVAANYMDEKGVAFYNNMLRQIKTQSPQ